jgi:type IV pilus assembly protein PilB
VLRVNRIDPDFFGDDLIYHPVGCSKCNNSGYKGRGAIMEVLPMSLALREGIMRGATTAELRDIGVEEGMVTLKEAGLRKVRAGITSIPAVLEVTGGD